MKISTWKKQKNTVQVPCYKISPPCPCGCSPKPFFYVFNGKIGITVEFDNIGEIQQFLKAASILTPFPKIKPSAITVPAKASKAKFPFNPSHRQCHLIRRKSKNENNKMRL